MLATKAYFSQNRWIRSKFARNVAIVASGTAGAQALNMAFTPFVTRLYGPEAFGLLGAFVAILTIVTPLAALNYPIALVLPKRDSDAVGIAKLSMKTALATAFLTFCILLVFQNSIIELFNLQNIAAYVFLLPVGMVFATAMLISNQWVIRKKLFKIKAQVIALQALWLNLAKVITGLFAPFAAALIIITVVGSAIHALMIFLRIKDPGTLHVPYERDAESPTPPLDLAKQHIDFPLYRTPQIFLNGLSQSMPVLMLAAFFGPASAGFYSLGKMVMGIPSTLIGQAVGSVFYPRFNEAVQTGENAFRLLGKATLALAAIGLLPFGTIILFGPWIFSLAFGSDWLVAGQYAQWLALWSFFGFINRPAIAAIPVLAIQGYFLIFEIVGISARAAALATGFIYFEDALTAVILFSIVNVILYSFLALMTIYIAYRRDKCAHG